MARRQTTVITEVPRVVDGRPAPADTIAIRYNPDGSVASRQRISIAEFRMLEEDEDTIKLPHTVVDDITAGKLSLDKAISSGSKAEDDSGIMSDLKDSASDTISALSSILPFGGNRRKRKIDDAIDEAIK